MVKVDGKTTGTYDGFIYIICGDRGKTICITANGDENDKFLCLDDCFEFIGFNKEKDIGLIVIIDDWLSGKVYRYNNYNDNCWYEVGITEGFA